MDCLGRIVALGEHVASDAFKLPDGKEFKSVVVKSKIFAGLPHYYTDCDLHGKEELRKADVSLRTYNMILEAAGIKGVATYAESQAKADKSE